MDSAGTHRPAAPTRPANDMAVQEPPLEGPGNFTGLWRCLETGKTLVFKRPTTPPTDYQGRQLGLDSLVVQTGCKMFNALGAWPAWFRWMVGWPIPRAIQLEASRLAAGASRGAA